MTGPRRGRPLRFVGAVATGWIGWRVVMLWPVAVPALSSGAMLVPPLPRTVPATLRRPAPVVAALGLPPVRTSGTPRATTAAGSSTPALVLPLPAAAALPQERGEVASSPTGPSLPPGIALGAAARLPGRDHWQASSWLVVRPGRGLGAAPGAGQLGGSQYGVRLVYGLRQDRRLAAYGRLAGPIHGRGAEAAIGIEWQPLRAPVRLSIEQRFGLDGVQDAPGGGVVAGLDRGIAPGMRLEAYGQAGMILRAEHAPYADGAVRLTAEIAHGPRTALALGVGAWGAAQRESQRLDIGPSLVANLPIGTVRARLALDWRQRIAGGARPGSGLALTLGSDF